MGVRSITVAVLLLALASAGCGLFHTGAEVVTHRSWESFEDCAEYLRNLRWAKDAWEQVSQSAGPRGFSDDYARGFREGFAELLYRGGCGEPPSVPPCEYRKMKYQTPEGYQAVLDWYAGYRHGALVARQGGYRDLVTGPSALRSPSCAAAPPVLSGSEPPISPPPPVPERPPAPAVPPRMLPPPNEAEKDEDVNPAGWNLNVDFAPWRRWW